MIPCDLCGADHPALILKSPRLDGPLVECRHCGLRYVGSRESRLAFGRDAAVEILQRVRSANAGLRHLRSSGRLLEVGCARGDFLRTAAGSFEVFGVEPNPELADVAAPAGPIHRDVIENVPWSNFDVAASFHVIEHVDSPTRFVRAIGERLKPG